MKKSEQVNRQRLLSLVFVLMLMSRHSDISTFILALVPPLKTTLKCTGQPSVTNNHIKTNRKSIYQALFITTKD